MADTSSPSAWPWPDRMDAVLAAPASHRVLVDNDRVRAVPLQAGSRVT